MTDRQVMTTAGLLDACPRWAMAG